MVMTLPEAANVMAGRYPDVVRRLNDAHNRGVRLALVGSRCAELAAISLGIDDLPPADDFDIQVLPEDFDEAVKVLAADVKWGETINTLTGDGRRMTFVADEAVAKVDEETIQFMRPHEPVVLGDSEFRTSFTPNAVKYRRLYHTPAGILPVSHSAESLTLYGLRQGVGNKHDARRAATIVAATGLWISPEHVALRAAEVGWDKRVLEFVTDATAKAVNLRRPSPDLVRRVSSARPLVGA